MKRINIREEATFSNEHFSLVGLVVEKHEYAFSFLYDLVILCSEGKLYDVRVDDKNFKVTIKLQEEVKDEA